MKLYFFSNFRALCTYMMSKIQFCFFPYIGFNRGHSHLCWIMALRLGYRRKTSIQHWHQPYLSSSISATKTSTNIVSGIFSNERMGPWECNHEWVRILITVWSEGFLYKVALPELKFSTIMYFVINNSLVLSKILKIVVP